VVSSGLIPYVASKIVVSQMNRSSTDFLYRRGLSKFPLVSNEEFYQYAHSYTNGSILVPLIELVEIEKHAQDIMKHPDFFKIVLDKYYQQHVDMNNQSREFLEKVGIFKPQVNVDIDQRLIRIESAVGKSVRDEAILIAANDPEIRKVAEEQAKKEMWDNCKAAFQQSLKEVEEERKVEAQTRANAILMGARDRIRAADAKEKERLGLVVKKREREEEILVNLEEEKRQKQYDITVLEKQRSRLSKQLAQIRVIQPARAPPRAQKGPAMSEYIRKNL
jgi:hypothetical protein